MKGGGGLDVLKLDVQGKKGVEEFSTQMDKGGGVLENWKILMDVMCVSSLIPN